MKKFFGQSGDTIVEVLISMVVLAIVAGTAYATSQRNFQAGLNSQQRDIATNYAQQQVELLKSADDNDLITTNFEVGSNFCIDPSTPAQTSTSCNIPFGTSDTDANYKIADTYDSAKKLFTITVSWTSGNRSQQTIVNYRPSRSFVNTPGGTCATCVETIVINPLVPAVVLNADNPNVDYGQPGHLSWATNKVKKNSCQATSTQEGTWTGQKADTGSADSTGILINYSGSGDDFTLVCRGLDNTILSSTAHITVNPPPLPAPAATNGNPVTYNSATMNGQVSPVGYAITSCKFYYDTATFSAGSALPTHGLPVSCAQSPSSIGSGTLPVPVNAALSGLSSDTTYHFQICIVDTFSRNTCSNDAFFTTLAVPKPIVVTGTASLVGSYTVTMNGTVNPNGYPTTYHLMGSWHGTGCRGVGHLRCL
jgi:type II secretory pathway pseudopilin PulG